MSEGQAVDKLQDGSPLPPPPARYRLTITEVTSVVIVTIRKSRGVIGSFSEAEALYRRVLTHNLIAGWWGFPFGPIWTVMALVRNGKAMAHLREIAGAGDIAAGWHPDPTGRHAQRYWDGRQWTDQVSDVSADPLGA